MFDNPIIAQVCTEIVQSFNPLKIILFSVKQDLNGEPASFKLVIIAENDGTLEHDIYLAVDCDIPYDVVVYSPHSWRELSTAPDSFAHRVDERGVVLYGEGK